MAVLDFTLTFAGVPFFSDAPKPYRLTPETLTDGPHSVPRKHQPLDSMLDDLERRFPMRLMEHSPDRAERWSRDTQALARLVWGSPQDYRLMVGDWHYPVGASRWSVFNGLATSRCAKAMLAAAAASPSQWFVCKADPDGTDRKGRTYEVKTRMRLLPPRPLGEEAGTEDGLYLITLVDERYHLRYRPVTLAVSHSDTWAGLIDSTASQLGITLTYSAIESGWGTPEQDSHLRTYSEDGPLLLDALAMNVGRAVVRKMDGTYALYTPRESAALADTSRKPSGSVTRHAGGDCFMSGTKTPAGDLRAARGLAVPSTVRLTCPKWVTTAPAHWLDSRTGTRWFEDSYSDTHAIDVPIASGGSAVSGVQTFSGTFTVHDTAKALYPTDAAARTSQPSNASGLTALAVLVARSHFENVALSGLDELYWGTLNWAPEGLHDVVWTYSPLRRRSSCRVMRREWSAAARDMQHAVGPVTVGGGGGGLAVTSGGSLWIDGSINYGNTTVTLTETSYSNLLVEQTNAIVTFLTTGDTVIHGFDPDSFGGDNSFFVVVNGGPDTITYYNESDEAAGGAAAIVVGGGGGNLVTGPGDSTTFWKDPENGYKVVSTTAVITQTAGTLTPGNGVVTNGSGIGPYTNFVTVTAGASGVTFTGLRSGGPGQTIYVASDPDSAGFVYLNGSSGIPYNGVWTPDDPFGGSVTYQIPAGGVTALDWDSSLLQWVPRIPTNAHPWNPVLTGDFSGIVAVPPGMTSLTPFVPAGGASIAGLTNLPPGPFTITNPLNSSGDLNLAHMALLYSGQPGAFAFSTSGDYTLMPGHTLVIDGGQTHPSEVGGSVLLITSGITGAGAGGRTFGDLTAAGTTVNDAAQVITDAARVYGADGTAGVRLPNSGASIVSVRNISGTGILQIYPPSGLRLDTFGSGQPVGAANGAAVIFYQTAPDRYNYTAYL